VPTARLVVVAEDGHEQAFRVISAARTLTTAPIVTRPLGEVDAALLAEAGADHVVDPRHVSGQVLTQAVLAVLGHTEPASDHRTVVDTARVVRYPWPDTGRCEHEDASRPVLARAPGCVACLRAGEDWVHLRICLKCGHVGCCDDSPNRHAREHAHTEDHPLVASAEPGETWGYCFVDDVTVPAPAGATPGRA
jgi:CPA2 family monovalent cation:H+ antiporter-2